MLPVKFAQFARHGNLPSFTQYSSALCFYGNSITLNCRIRLRPVLPVKFAQVATHGNLPSFTQYTSTLYLYGNSITLHCRIHPLLTACSILSFPVTLLRLWKCGYRYRKLRHTAICRRLLRNKLPHYVLRKFSNTSLPYSPATYGQLRTLFYPNSTSLVEMRLPLPYIATHGNFLPAITQ